MKNATPEELVRYFSDRKITALIAYIQKLGTYREIEADPKRKPNPLDPDSYQRSNPEARSARS